MSTVKLNDKHRKAINQWMESDGLTATSAAKKIDVTLAAFRKYLNGGGMHEIP